MPKYQVTKTESVEVWADDEKHAEEVANGEMYENPNATYEVERLTPEVLANLDALKVYLEAMGLYAVSVEQPHHTPMKYLSIGLHKVEDYKGDIVPCAKYYLYGHTDDGTFWNGTGWGLETCEGEEVAQFENVDTLKLAGLITYNIGRADFDLESRGN